MNKYTIYSTEEQTKKALELGAPLFRYTSIPNFAEVIEISTSEYYEIPTAEQMIGWLEDQGQSIEVCRLNRNNPNWSAFVDDTQIIGKYYPTRKVAILDAIDAALEYLKKSKT